MGKDTGEGGEGEEGNGRGRQWRKRRQRERNMLGKRKISKERQGVKRREEKRPGWCKERRIHDVLNGRGRERKELRKHESLVSFADRRVAAPCHSVLINTGTTINICKPSSAQ